MSETDAVGFLKRRFSEREEQAENPSLSRLDGRKGAPSKTFIFSMGGIVVLRSSPKDQAKDLYNFDEELRKFIEAINGSDRLILVTGLRRTGKT